MAQWNFDKAHTNVEFVVRHMMVSNVRGSFGEYDGIINFDPANPAASSVEVTIQTASIDTGVADRDNHLRSADFFDAATYPTITFKSTAVQVVDDNNVKLTGDLTMHGVTKPVTLDVEYLGQGNSPFGDVRAGFEASTKINREDFGLGWNVALEAGGVLVGKEIKIQLAVEAVKVTETATA
jgi:polyisoprenoid-binding protein YceI